MHFRLAKNLYKMILLKSLLLIVLFHIKWISMLDGGESKLKKTMGARNFGPKFTGKVNFWMKNHASQT